MAELYLINEESGLGIDFRVLDRIQHQRKTYIVLTPATETDQEIAEDLSEDCPQDADTGTAGETYRDIWILEVSVNRKDEAVYLRVEEETLQKVFTIFRNKHADKYDFG